MTREEAINLVKQVFPCLNVDEKIREGFKTLIPELAESEDERMMREFNDWLCEEIECRTNDLRDEKDRRTLNMLCYILTKVKAYLEKQKINTEGDFGRGYDCGYEACLNSHGAEWLEKQKEQKPVEWTELTWKDIVELEGIINNVHYDFSAGIGQESFGKEVLERFRNKKDDAEVDACEQKPAENMSHLPVQGKGVYKICPRCKERMVRDDSKVYTSMPPQYGYNCPKCGAMEFDTVIYDNPEMEEQKPIVMHTPRYVPPEQKPAEYLDKDKVYAIMKKLHDLAFSQRIPIDSDEYKKIGEITSDVRSLLDYPVEQKSIDYEVELKKCKDNPLYFFDKYVKVKLKQAEWSEEDENMMNRLIGVLDGTNKEDYHEGWEEIFLPWLKSFRPQPKQEWSEEDNNFAYFVNQFLEYHEKTDPTAKSCKDWFNGRLRSLRPSWKPSEYQMDALKDVIETVPMTCRQQVPLESLYSDLNKNF